MSLKMAKSLYGHDAGKIYVVLNEDDGFVYLVDGKIKTLEHPKKKNKKHIQLIQNIPDEVKEILDSENRDLEMKRAIKVYTKCR